jgi:hypothetical protein
MGRGRIVLRLIVRLLDVELPTGLGRKSLHRLRVRTSLGVLLSISSRFGALLLQCGHNEIRNGSAPTFAVPYGPVGEGPVESMILRKQVERYLVLIPRVWIPVQCVAALFKIWLAMQLEKSLDYRSTTSRSAGNHLRARFGYGVSSQKSASIPPRL